MKLLEMRSRFDPPIGPSDPLETFGIKFGMSDDNLKRLRSLDFDRLQDLIDCFDGTSAVDELVSDDVIPEEEEVPDIGLPVMPGQVTVSRLLRLDLIDPEADALV